MQNNKPLTGMYRLQLGQEAGLNLIQAADVFAAYTQTLLGHNPRKAGRVGIYLPPIQESPADSNHYYNGLDPNKVAANLGGSEGLSYLTEKLGALDIERILDIVPNHGNVTWDALQAFKTGGADLPSGNVFWDSPLRNQVFDLDTTTRWVRRFFDVDTLAGYKVDDEKVLELTHQMLFELVKSGAITGVRIDHPDGLREPTTYLKRLAKRLAELTGGKNVPVWVEKVLVGDEKLSPQWPVAGTVGYEWLKVSGAMWVPSACEQVVTATYNQAAKDTRTFDVSLAQARKEVAAAAFCGQGAEVDFLVSVLAEPTLSDAGREKLAAAIRQSLTALNVYRTYMNADTGEVPASDRQLIEQAVAGLAMDARIGSILLGDEPGDAESQERYRKFTAYWQHFTGPNMAMGAENTAFFRYARNIGLNEVGGDPAKLSFSFAQMHALNQYHQQHLPFTGLAKATHDTKLGWFTRNLILAMLEFGDEYCQTLWPVWRDRYQHLLGDGQTDGGVDRVLWQLIQVVIGAGLGVKPIAFERVEQYLLKALCEAKKETHWCHRNQEWESKVIACAKAMYAGTPDGSVKPLTDDASFIDFVQRVHKIARRNSLRQMLLMMTSPGLPMFYQGDEIWEPYFVDPDNRRRQDWHALQAMLARVLNGECDGEIDLMVMIHTVMGFRNDNPELFGADSQYDVLNEGDGVFAFSRSINGKRIRVSAGGKLTGGNDLLAHFDDVSLSV